MGTDLGSKPDTGVEHNTMGTGTGTGSDSSRDMGTAMGDGTNTVNVTHTNSDMNTGLTKGIPDTFGTVIDTVTCVYMNADSGSCVDPGTDLFVICDTETRSNEASNDPFSLLRPPSHLLRPRSLF
jgi:hypothetical protein